jgi:hypothetical protein
LFQGSHAGEKKVSPFQYGCIAFLPGGGKAMNSLLVKALLLPIVVGPVSMRADVVFSNLTGTGPVTGSSNVCGALASGCGNGGGVWDASGFTPAANYSLTDAQMLVAKSLVDAPYTFDVFLYSNNGGVPGSAIEQIGFGLTASANYPGSLITANTVSTPITLVSGTPYWLVLAPASAKSFITWSNAGSPEAPFAQSLDGGNTWGVNNDLTPQFQIDGTPVAAVPEPSSFLLLGIATLLCGIRQFHART